MLPTVQRHQRPNPLTWKKPLFTVNPIPTVRKMATVQGPHTARCS